MILKILWTLINNILNKELYSFLVDDRTLSSDNQLRFRKTYKNEYQWKNLKINDKIEQNKAQYDLDS